MDEENRNINETKEKEGSDPQNITDAENEAVSEKKQNEEIKMPADGTEPNETDNASEKTPEDLPEDDEKTEELPEEDKESVGESADDNTDQAKPKVKKKGFSKERIIIICGLAVLLIAVICLIVFGNGGSSESEEAGNNTVIVVEKISPTPVPTITSLPTPTPTPTSTPTPTPDPHIGEKKSALNGEWLPEDIANQRPYCIMFNNIEVANPQSGLGEAKIVYEILVEAGITRLMGVFENLTDESSLSERIGSVRSARHYYASIADEYDAIFIHYGETSYAVRKIQKLGLDHMDGCDGIGSTVFYRDNTIKAPHNAFATLSGIRKGIEKLGIRTEHEDEWSNHFDFYDEETELPEDAEKAEKVKLGFSTYTSPYLTYDPVEKLYTRYQFGDVHIDYNTGEPLKFKNIIIQIVHEYNKDKNGYQTMDIENNSGDGYYITNGKLKKITWKKNEKKRFMEYYDESGELLTINPGKTFIAVYPDFRTENLKFE